MWVFTALLATEPTPSLTYVVFMQVFLEFLVSVVLVQITTIFTGNRWEVGRLLFLIWRWMYVTPLIFLTTGFFTLFTPFCLLFTFEAEAEEIWPWLVRFKEI